MVVKVFKVYRSPDFKPGTDEFKNFDDILKEIRSVIDWKRYKKYLDNLFKSGIIITRNTIPLICDDTDLLIGIKTSVVYRSNEDFDRHKFEYGDQVIEKLRLAGWIFEEEIKDISL